MFNSLKVLFILATLSASIPGYALLEGKTIRRKPHHPVVTLRIKDTRESTRCTGSFVSTNTIITAAHCFDQLVKSCSENPGCAKKSHPGAYQLYPEESSSLWINKSRVTRPYKILRHTSYKSASENGYRDYDTTNEDVAMIILSTQARHQGFVRVSRKKPALGAPAWIYGAGMTKVQLYSNPATGEAYNIEANAGRMKKTKSQIPGPIKNGLIEIPSTLVGRLTSQHLYDLSIANGVQVLSADSGGPLLEDRTLHGITRNFVFTFSPNRAPASEDRPFRISGRSIFTSLATKSQNAFLKSAAKFGGQVTFID